MSGAMSQTRFLSLWKYLVDAGHYGPVVAGIEYSPAVGAVVAYDPGADPEAVAAVQALVSEWPWGEGEMHALEIPWRIQAAAAVLQSSDPVGDAARLAFRLVVDWANECIRAGVWTELLEDEFNSRAALYLARGLSLPGPRQD